MCVPLRTYSADYAGERKDYADRWASKKSSIRVDPSLIRVIRGFILTIQAEALVGEAVEAAATTLRLIATMRERHRQHAGGEQGEVAGRGGLVISEPRPGAISVSPR